MKFRLAALLPFLWAAIDSLAAAAQVASDDERPSVAVVFGGGGAHAIAHVGILEELERQRVPIDLVVGTGIGGVIGGLYASGMAPAEIREFFMTTDWEDIFNPDTRREDLSFRRKRDDEDFLIKYRVGIKDGTAQLPAAVVPNEKLARLLQATVAGTKGINDFDDLPVPFRAVAMDLVSGEEVILDSGSLDRAMLATLSAPGILPPVVVNGRSLVTGSIINNLPVDVARTRGADVIIVVNIGAYTRSADELNSVFRIVEQVGHLVQRHNSEARIASLRESDIVLEPAVTLAGETDYSAREIYIEEGARAVLAVSDLLDEISMSESAYAGLQAGRVARRTAEPLITAIELVNESEVDDALILAMLRQPINSPLDQEQLEADMRRIFGLGAFSSVDFSLLPQGENAVLRLRTLENRTGNRFWRFGISMQDDLAGNSAYTASASMTWTQLNRLGGEWRSVFRVGERQQAYTEFYQPIDKLGRYFISASGGFFERNVNRIENGDITSQARVQELVGSLNFGRIIGNSSQIRVGMLRGRGKTRSNIGTTFPSVDFDIGGFASSFDYDTYDNVYFPQHGTRAGLSWTAQRESFGSSIDADIAGGLIASVRSWGEHNLLGALEVETQLNNVPGAHNLVQTGGLFHLSGYQRDELSGRHAAVGRVIYYQRIRSNPLRGLLDATLYTGASLELGNAWQSSRDISLSNTITAGALFIGADTFIGPVYLAGGLAEGGRSALYLFIGRPF